MSRVQYKRVLAQLRNREDPNQGLNRVPSKSELVTLRNLYSQNCRISETLEKELSVARDMHEQSQSRHKSLLHELESARSEINASDRLITLLE
jgi:hypothetical protein